MLLRSRIAKPAATGISEVDARNSVANAVQPLERRIESLELACTAMWELLKSKVEVTDEELRDLMHKLEGPQHSEISIDDEVETEETCPTCGRKVLTKRGARCLWCGAEIVRGPFGG